MNLEGEVSPISETPRGFEFLRLSPDGRTVAFSLIEGPTHEVSIYDIERGTITPVLRDVISDLPIWTPDGRGLLFASTTGGPWHIFAWPVDGSRQAEQLTTAQMFDLPGSVSPDGALLAYYRDIGDRAGLWILDLATGEEKEFFSRPGIQEEEPRFSPDGRFLAYTADYDGRPEVYVLPYPGPGGEVKISNAGGWDALWAPDGSALYFRSGRDIMKVLIETEPEFRARRPELLFRGPDLGGLKYYRSWDIAPDGKSFVAIERSSAPTELHVVVNWAEELKRLVPTN